MNNIIKKLPIPMAGLMLGSAALGNLVMSYGSIYRYSFGILSAIIMILLIIKTIKMPKSLVEGFDNPVIASVMPTFSMGMVILSTYIKPFFSTAAHGLWFAGLGLHLFFIIIFTIKYLFNFNIKKVFPSYFVVYVGIVTGSVTAPAFGLTNLGQLLFWFGFISYLILLPIVLYRVWVIKNIPEPAIPTFTIMVAPGSLLLTGYLNSFQEKNIMIVSLLGILSALILASVILYIPKMLKLQFYPSYSAFTFPIVITAIAMKGTNAYLNNIGNGLAFLGPAVKVLELCSVSIVLYVLVRYFIFLTAAPAVELVEVNRK